MRAVRDWNSAMIRLRLMCSPATNPVLNDAELATLLLDRQRVAVWTPNTRFVVGDRAVPSVPNGKAYRVAVNPYGLWGPEAGGGTSGSVEPAWQGATDWPRLGLPGIADGDDGLFWAEDGPEPSCYWDLRGAAYDAWMLKCAKATPKFNTAADRATFYQSQVYLQCEKQAAKYKPLGISSG